VLDVPMQRKELGIKLQLWQRKLQKNERLTEGIKQRPNNERLIEHETQQMRQRLPLFPMLLVA
jgi:hypothetical protein